MSLAKDPSSSVGGTVLAIRKHEDGSYHIGYPNRMFEFDAYSYYEFKFVCSFFGLAYQTLFDFITNADSNPNEFHFMTL